MPDIFLKITFKWVVELISLNYLSSWLLFYCINNSSILESEFYSRGDVVGIVFPSIFWLIFSLMLGLGLRDLVRSNEYKISVEVIFGFATCIILIPILINFGVLFYRSFIDENIARMFENGAYPYSIFNSVLTKTLYTLFVITLVSHWRIFRKAGKKGWHALIPIYNLVLICDIIKKDRSLVFLFFIPIINIGAVAAVTNGMAKVFSKSSIFSVGLFFLPFIFFPILAFGKNEYIYGEYKLVKEDLDLEDHLVQ